MCAQNAPEPVTSYLPAVGDSIRIKEWASRPGVILGAGPYPGEWHVALLDGERNIFLTEHLAPYLLEPKKKRLYEG